MFQEVGGLYGVSERGGGDLSLGLSQPGGKAVEQSGGAGFLCSGTIFLMVGAERDCGKGGWGPSQYYLLCWSIVQGKYPG